MITVRMDAADAAEKVQRLADGLRRRGGLNARLASTGEAFTRQAVARLDADPGEHATAAELGANPSGHFLKQIPGIEGHATDNGAEILIPRASRLRAAFGGYTVVKKDKWLTEAADARTYGRSARDFPEGTFDCRWMGRGLALVFKIDNKVGYWLRAKVTIKGNPKLLPFDQYPVLMSRVGSAYYAELMANDSTPEA